jgi:hypothetical protein
VVTGRAVVVIISVDVAGLVLLSVTDGLVKLHAEAAGRPEQERLILEV